MGGAGGKGGMDMGLHIRGYDPLFEHPTDCDQCPRLDTCRQPENMRTDGAQDHSVSILFTFSLIFSSSSYLSSATASSFLCNFLLYHWLCICRNCSASVLCLSIPFSDILHLLIRAHLMQSVPGVGGTSGAAWGADAYWHTHYAAQGVPMVKNGQVSFTA